MKPILIIGVDQVGRVRVNGPLHDRVTCYGLLEAAKDAVRDYKPHEPGIEIGEAQQELNKVLAAMKGQY